MVIQLERISTHHGPLQSQERLQRAPQQPPSSRDCETV
jgi:hypothetical protein